MATTWVKGLSERQGPRAPRLAKTLLRMIQKVGDERVPYPPEGEGGVLMSRREALARVLWTRALQDGDLSCAKFLMECIDAQAAGGSEGAPAGQPVRRKDVDTAEKLLVEWSTQKE